MCALMEESTDDVAQGRSWRTVAAVATVIAVLVATGAVLWWSDIVDDEITLTATTEGPTASSTAIATTTTTATPTTTTIAPTSSTTSTTIASTTTSVPPSLIPPDLGTLMWTVPSEFLGGNVTLELAATDGQVSVYDALVGADQSMRCAVVVAVGVERWREWCGSAGRAVAVLTSDGTDVLLVELGEQVGFVTITKMGTVWQSPTNGCSSPAFELVEVAAVDPAVVTGLVCVGDEAFVRHSPVFLQDGPRDGGGVLLVTEADGTWSSSGGGTAFPCDDPVADGIDRCVSFDAESDLFEAVLPIPGEAAQPGTTDIVDVNDATNDVREIVEAQNESFDPTDAAEVGDLIADWYRDQDGPDPSVDLYPDLGDGNLTLAIVELPALDDSIQSTTYAAWISTTDDDQFEPVARVVTWMTCARGLAGQDLCI